MFFSWPKIASIAALFVLPLAHAGVVINGTRVIYPAQEREVSVKLDNKNAHPSLVQAWIDGGDMKASPEDADVPFVLTPPMFRMEPSKSQTLRIRAVDPNFPEDRESLFWFNALEVPPKPLAEDGARARNYMQLAFRTRIKLFYRPKSLPYSAIEARSKLVVRLVKSGSGWDVSIDNPTPYYMSFSEIGVSVGERKYGKGAGLHGGGGMVAPHSQVTFAIDGLPASTAGAKPALTLIDDYGALIELKDIKFTP